MLSKTDLIDLDFELKCLRIRLDPSALGFVPLSLVCWNFKKRELAQFACYANAPDMLLWTWRLEFY